MKKQNNIPSCAGYIVEEKIGKGTSGDVYRVKREGLLSDHTRIAGQTWSFMKTVAMGNSALAFKINGIQISLKYEERLLLQWLRLAQEQ